MPRNAPHSRRRSRTSCSVIALATVMAVGPTPAAAQSLLGTGTYVTNPNVTGITTGPGTTTVNLNGGQTVIDWTPTNNAIDPNNPITFQNAGTTALFTGSADFAVLNRVLPADISRAIVMNGTVNSQVGGSQRGSVYFYSPSGFIFGGTSVFNVGSLVVTALPITLTGSNFINSNTVVFGQALNPSAAISSAGTINASSAPIGVIPPGQSYVAMVAPRVAHSGTITANGSTALVAAEAATINFSPDGLFDIQVTVGTTSSDGILVAGNIGGPVPTSASDTQAVYLVAVPKNDALTMVIGNGADLGFTLANNATIDDAGVVVLSAGHDIVDGQIGARSAGHGASATGNFWFTGAHATNNLFGEATGTADLYSVSPNMTTTFDNDVTVHAAQHVWMNASGVGTSLTVGGDLSLSADATGASGQSVTAGDVKLYSLNDAIVSVAGSTTLSANATGGDASSGTAGSGTGGTIWVNTDDGGSLSIAALTATATGTGGDGLAAGVNAGQGTGGTLRLYGDDTGSVLVNGALSFDAKGTGGDADGAGLAGAGQGGNAYVYIGDDASVTINGSTMIGSDGQGGAHATGTGGAGTGGESRVTAVDLSVSGGLITFNGDVTLSSDGTGGTSGGAGTGGTGTGGWARISTPIAHDVAVNGTAYLHALGNGGGSSTGTGGVGQGGVAELVGLLGDIDISSTVTVSSSGQGGSGSLGGIGQGGFSAISSQSDIALPGSAYLYSQGEGGTGFNGNGGYGEGGIISVEADGGDLTIGSLSADARGDGGHSSQNGATSGNGQGGDIFIQSFANSSLSVANGVSANADGEGGSVGFLVGGGSGTGGDITVEAVGANAALSVTGSTYLTANGYGGEGNDCFLCGGLGGDGFGGDIFVRANGATATVNLGDINAYARGFGGLGFESDGGDGTGGTVQFSAIDGGSLHVTGSLYGSASGFGGDRTEGGYGGDPDMFAGDGIGGTVEILTFGTGNPSILIDGYAQIEANGHGGDVFFQQFFQEGGGPSFADESIQGGDGFGGQAGIYSDAGRISDDDIPSNDGGIRIGSNAYVDANGYGGNAQGGFGGDGTGNNAEIFANGGDVAIGGWAYVSADGSGGYGDFGGDGFGGGDYDPDTNTGTGGAHLLAKDGTLTLGGASVSADGYGADGGNGYFYGGGTGGDGGDGTGGWATVRAANSDNGPSLIYVSEVESSLNISADGYGGDGDSGFDGTNGLDGIGGAGGSVGEPGEDGTDGGAGGAGGAGGSGTGGFVSVTAAAGNGELDINTVYASALGDGGDGGAGGAGGFGGWGGAGGNGDGGAGGNGGNGGNGGAGGVGGAGGLATGGSVTIGTASGSHEAIANNLGLATFGYAYVDASAIGGSGGDGGSFGSAGMGGAAGTGDPSGQAGANGIDGAGGNGGDGGDAVGGGTTLLVRGSTVDVGTIELVANATGGDGGSGYYYGGGIDGFGGDATVGGDGGIGVLVTPRFMIPAHLGTLNAGSIFGSAVASGGSGSIFGTSESLGANYVMFVNSTGNLGSLAFTVGADGLGEGALQDRISLVGSNVTAGAFTFDTVGDLSLLVDNGSFNVGTLTLTAGNFVHDGATPTNLGTTFADNVFITTGNDFIADTNWDVTNTFVVDAPGLIDLDNIHDDNGIDFSAGGSIIITSLDAGTYVDLLAGGDIGTGNIDAGSSVNEQSTGGSINFNNINAGSSVSLDAGTSISGADIHTGGSIFAQAHDGDINLVNLTSTFGSITLDAAGDIFLDGDALADGDIELAATGDILMHNATSHQSIDINGGGYVDGDNLTAGDTVEVEAASWVTLGNLSAGIVNPSFNLDADYVAAIHAGGDILVTGNIEAAQHVGLATPGTITVQGTIDAGGTFMALGTGDMSFGDANAGSEIYLADYSMMALGGEITDEFDPLPVLASLPTPTGGSITIGDVNAGKFTAAAGTSLTTGILDVTGAANLYALDDIDIISADVGFFYAEAGTFFNSGNITSDSDIRLFTGDDVTVGQLVAGVPSDVSNHIAIRIISGGSVSLVGIDSLGGIDITADGSVIGGNVTTGNVLFTDALGLIQYGNISAGLVNPQPQSDAFSVGLVSGTSIDVGTVDAAFGAVFASVGTIDTGNINAGTDVLGLANGAILLGNISAGDRVLLADYSMFTDAGGTIPTGEGIDIESIFAATPVPTNSSITVGNVLAGSFTAAAGTSLTTGLIDTDSEIALGAGGAIQTGDLFAGDFVLANGGSILTGNIDADSVAMTSTGGNITTGDIFAFGDVALDAFGDILTGDITAATIDLFANGDITTDNLTTQLILLLGQEGSGTKTFLFPGASITLEAGSDISTDNIDSIDGVYANAGGSLSTGTIDAVDFVDINSTGNMLTGAITAGSDLFADAGGTMSLGVLSAFDIELESIGNMSFVSANAGTEFDFSSEGSVNGGNVTAGSQISGDAGGSVTLLALTVSGPPEVGEDFSIGIAAVGNITVGNVSGFAPVGFATQSNLSTGNVTAGELFMTLVGGNTTTGSITTGGEGGGQVYMADDSMFITGGGTIDGEGDFDPSIVLALDPVPTGGSITINGAVNTGLFEAAAGTSLTTQAITASDIHARAGGLATLNGVWNVSNQANLSSNDIDITATGGIDGGTTGEIALFSSNPTQMLIGDGLSGTGYALSNAEFGRLSGADVAILGRGDASAAIDMLIGDLTVTGPQAGSTIESADGVLVFAVGDIDAETASGVIRVAGDVNATGFGADNAIEFYATRFELDAATGSISIFSSGSTLGGEIGLYADRIHVASATILDQLAANPTYSGYQQDLNEAATVQRPEGVLRASRLWIESDNLQDILIQNTGTAATPAGFLVNEAFVNDDEEVAGPPGSINLVVNGQVVTEGGTLTGIDARDALTEEADLTPFTTNSTINGCPLTGPCIVQPEQPDPPPAVVDDQIDLITFDPLGDSDFGNEPDIDDNEEGDEGANNPISPPQPLFDTRPLIPSSDVNDPVSGTGNPSLMGSDCDKDDQGQCATVEEDGQ